MGSSPPPKPPSSEQFNIRWKNYTTVLQSTFRDLLEEERLVDVTLACEGGFIKCHRIILSACSSYFENLLNELGSSDGGTGGGNLVIFMKDLKLWELQALIHFMYNGEVSVRQNRLAPLVRAAESLKIRGLSTDKTEDKAGSRNGGSGGQDNAMPRRIVRRASTSMSGVNGAIRSDQGQKAPGAGPLQPVKRESISGEGSGGGVPCKIMKTTKIGQGQPGNSQASSGSSIQNRPKQVVRMGENGSPRSGQQRIASRSNSNEGEDSGGQLNNEEEDLSDKLSSESGDPDPQDEAGYLEDVDTTAYYEEDGSEVVDNAGEEYPDGPPPTMSPPLTFPVIDAADRAERLRKATDLALSGVTVRQAASHYAIPRTTLCAYMKRRGYAGKRVAPGNQTQYFQQGQSQEGEGHEGQNGEELYEEFPFLGGLAELLKEQPQNQYQMQRNSC